MAKEDESRIEYVRDLQRKSPFDPKNHGIAADKAKERRWVDPRKIEMRKSGDGYQFVKPKEGLGAMADGTVRTLGGMVLMERPQEVADARAKLKELATKTKTQSAKDALRNKIEAMSSAVGKNLHKYVDEYENENK